jgi:predicted RNA binding protein YcfA (HicA-like mRNA interferase family)
MAKNQLRDLMKVHQFTLKRSKGKHLIWKHFDGATVTTAKTPSDHRALKNIERDIRHALDQVTS